SHEVIVQTIAATTTRVVLPVADADAGGVGVGVQLCVHAEPGAGGGGGDGLRDDFVAGQGPAAPVEGDVREEPVLDLVPFRGAGRQVAHGDGQPGLGRQFGEFGFEGAGAVAVGAARVGGDQQP